MSDLLRIEYVPLSKVRRWSRNPKAHDIGALCRSIELYGFRDPPAYDAALDALVEGNGRDEALEAMQAQRMEIPRGIAQDKDTGEWCMPVLFGVDARSAAMAEAYAIDHNNLVLSGGDFTAVDMARMWTDDYTAIIQSLAEQDSLPVSVDGDDLDTLLALANTENVPGNVDVTTPTQARTTLAERFGVPPFSVLDARQGYWQARKRAWIALGIQSEMGRGETILYEADQITAPSLNYGSNLERARPKMANDGMQDSPDELRIDAYRRQSAGDYSKSGAVAPMGGSHIDRLLDMRAAQKAKRANASPGGSPDAATRLEDGHSVRGDGAGKPIRRASGLARSFGQDLMRGEYTNVKPGRRQPETASLRDGLTWATSIRPYDATGEKRNSRAAADQRSNIQGASPLPIGATETGTANMATGTSIFDPVLCELTYRWFCPDGGAVLDPFAGGSVRGIVAALLGRQYTGIDLRPEQIAANEDQAQAITPDAIPRWIAGDSRDTATLAPGVYDLIFSCPPYADLEVYSDDPRDLSTLDYPAFLVAYRQIIAACVGMLRRNRFAVFVVGDVRDPRGFYRNFVSDTVAAFQDAGATLYNEGILVTAVGSLPIRIAKQFEGYRKLGKTHQNVLVFFKGDPKKIKDFGPVEMGDPEAFGLTDEAGDGD